MSNLITWLRLLIIFLALISFILGVTLSANSVFPDKLPLMMITDALTVVFYARFASGSQKARQNRTLRIFLRIAFAFLTVFGPVKALRECHYKLERDYGRNSPGIHFDEVIKCADDSRHRRTDEGEESILPEFRLFRARCIITLTVCVLILVEMFMYGWSDEGKDRPEDEAAAEDVELAERSGNGPQKMVLPDPVGLIIGLVLKEVLRAPNDLTITLVSEAIVVVLYIEFIYSAKAVHARVWRTFLRIVLEFLALYGPSRILAECHYSLDRDYGRRRPGFDYYDQIRCENDFTEARDDGPLLHTFRLLRARSMMMLTVAVLILVELICYVRSNEGMKPPREGPMAETRHDAEPANTSFDDHQKMIVLDVPNSNNNNIAAA
ncbi:hypothetical protein EC968_009991 [Mortierella alpina]|nr:hypothetical protein EC968_009991 [Mortierella alpina]